MSVLAQAQEFLATSTLSLFVDSKSQELATLTEYSTIAQAMELLASKHIMSAPVLDQDSEYTGCVSVGDILKGLTKDLVEAFGPHYAEDISAVAAEKLREVGEDFTAKSVRSILHDGDLWLKGDPTTTLMDVILKGFNVQERQIHHRIYVCDPAKAARTATEGRTTVVNIEPGTEALEASGWKPTDVVSQLDMVIVLAQHKEVLGTVAGQSLADIEAFVGTEQTVQGGVPALEAFHTMAVDHKSTLGITDAAGKLVGNLSISDLRYLPAAGFDLLLRPVAEYVALVHGKGPSLQEALGGARVEGAAEGEWRIVLEGTPLVTLLPSATFEDMLDAFVKHRAHRVHVVDEEGHPVSIITLTDVLRLVTRMPRPERVSLTRRPVEEEEEDEDEDEE